MINYSGYHKKPNLRIVLLYVILKKVTKNAFYCGSESISHVLTSLCELGIALGNRSMRVQPTDY